MQKFKLNKISFLLGKNAINVKSYKESFPEWDLEKIVSKTGINTINKVGEGETAVDLAVNTLNLFLKEHAFEKTDIDSLIFVTQSPDYSLPTSACIIQDMVGLRKNILVFDINLGCSGFVNALSVASSLISNNVVKNCAIVCAETYSKYISSSNRTCSTIFSDGASVSLLERGNATQIGPFNFGVDGSGFKNLIVEGSGSRKSDRNFKELFMNGPEILLFTLGHVPKLIFNFLEEHKLLFEDIDLFIFHQASKTVLDALKKKLKIPNNKFTYDLGEIGNTVSSTIPISLKLAIDKNKLKIGDKILIVGFGVGYSSGIGLIKWGY